MIEGREKIHRLGREIVNELRNHIMREQGVEPQITHSEVIPGTLTIHAEGYNTEGFVVTITETNRRVDHHHV